MRRVSDRRLGGRLGFTLIEVSVGLIASSILLLGLAGSLFLATQANRLDLGPFRHSSTGASALDEATRELSYATKVRAVTPGRSIEIEVPDRTGDGAADVVRYEWSGTAGTPLQRWFNGGTSSNVAASLQTFDLQTTSRTVTEQTIGDVTNTSGLAQWYDKSSAALLEGSTSLGSGDGVGTDFLPTLPEGAVTWSPTWVEVRCRSSGSESGVIRVRLWTADANRRPETLLAEKTINEWDLDDDWNWHAINFSPAPAVSIAQRICITFQHQSGSNTVMQLREDELGLGLPYWKLSTTNGGSSWLQTITKGIYLRVYGTYTYAMGGVVDVNRTYQTSIGLEAQSGTDATARMTGTARLRNKVECAMSRRTFRHRRSAFSLIEVAISSILVGSILVAALSTVGAVLRFRSSTSDTGRAALLATDLLAEIQSRPYADPNQTPVLGKESGETTRSQFDDVDDYDGLSEAPPKNLAGTNLTGFTGWTRSVSVVRAQRNSPMQTAGSDEGLKRIRITVSKNGATLQTLDALKADL